MPELKFTKFTEFTEPPDVGAAGAVRDCEELPAEALALAEKFWLTNAQSGGRGGPRQTARELVGPAVWRR